MAKTRVDASLPLTEYDETFLGRICALGEYMLPADAPDRRRRSFSKLMALGFIERHPTMFMVARPTWNGAGYIRLCSRRYGARSENAA